MMFFSLYVQQHQWITNTLLAGLALTVMFCLTYWALWRPREVERERENRIRITGPLSFCRWIISFVPWVLVLTILGSLIYTIGHTWMAAISTPNW